MTAQQSEDADNLRLRKAIEHIEYCKQAEAKVLRDLADARQTLARAREKHETLFLECEKRARRSQEVRPDRMRSGILS